MLLVSSSLRLKPSILLLFEIISATLSKVSLHYTSEYILQYAPRNLIITNQHQLEYVPQYVNVLECVPISYDKYRGTYHDMYLGTYRLVMAKKIWSMLLVTCSKIAPAVLGHRWPLYFHPWSPICCIYNYLSNSQSRKILRYWLPINSNPNNSNYLCAILAQ
jgi:hypothetical protein